MKIFGFEDGDGFESILLVPDPNTQLNINIYLLFVV